MVSSLWVCKAWQFAGYLALTFKPFLTCPLPPLVCLVMQAFLPSSLLHQSLPLAEKACPSIQRGEKYWDQVSVKTLTLDICASSALARPSRRHLATASPWRGAHQIRGSLSASWGFPATPGLSSHLPIQNLITTIYTRASQNRFLFIVVIKSWAAL